MKFGTTNEENLSFNSASNLFMVKKKQLTSRTDLAVIISLRSCEMYNSSPGIFGKLFFDSLRSSNLK